MWGMTRKDLLMPYVWRILAVVAVIGLAALGVHLATKEKPPKPGQPVTIEGDVQSPMFTTIGRPDSSETVSIIIVNVSTRDGHLKRLVWLQGREAFELKYDAVAVQGGRARVTYAPDTVFEGIRFHGTVLDMVPVK